VDEVEESLLEEGLVDEPHMSLGSMASSDMYTDPMVLELVVSETATSAFEHASVAPPPHRHTSTPLLLITLLASTFSTLSVDFFGLL